MKLIQKLSSILLLIFISVVVYADVSLTDKEYAALLNRLKQDKILLNNQNIIWNKLKTSKPKITYTVSDNGIVIETVEIPVYNNKPIVYEVKFAIVPKEDLKWAPWTFQLCGTIETSYVARRTINSLGVSELEKFTVTPDIKLGLRFFSTAPLGIPFFNIGFNAMVGIHSAGLSISYQLPKPLKNTAIHFYAGISYKAQPVYGFGISLNF